MLTDFYKPWKIILFDLNKLWVGANFEWVKCYRVLTIDSVAVCASFFDRSDELTKMEEAQIELVYVTDRIICKL